MMTTTQDNETLVRRGYAAFSTGDIPTLAEVIAEDCVWHVAGRNRLSGEKRGRDATFAYFGELAQVAGGSFRTELTNVIANDDFVAAISDTSARRDGKDVRATTVIVFRVRDGRLVEAWEHNNDTRLFDEMVG